MAGSAFSNEPLSVRLALDVCAQWKLENGRHTLSLDDLATIKEWMDTPGPLISQFPNLRALAAKGIEVLITQKRRENTVQADK